MKLGSRENTPAELWKSVKGIVGWNNPGRPTRLFENANYVNSPSGLAATMNKYLIEKVKKLRYSIPLVATDPLSRLCDTIQK